MGWEGATVMDQRFTDLPWLVLADNVSATLVATVATELKIPVKPIQALVYVINPFLLATCKQIKTDHNPPF